MELNWEQIDSNMGVFYRADVGDGYLIAPSGFNSVAYVPHPVAGDALPWGSDREDLDGEIKRSVLGVLVLEGKIPAIKYYRERTCCGLKDAKDYVEALPGGR